VIIEHVLLPVSADQRAQFLDVFAFARRFIEPSPGFRGLSIHPPINDDGPMLLMVMWDSVADHQDGFRQSERYVQWKALLHPFYPTMPTVSYFAESI